jgi:hypothetical protein
LQQYKSTDNSIHIFHEGKDDPSFYSNYLERGRLKRQRVYYYLFNNKKGVYFHYEKINWLKFKKNRLLFFVDKDLDDILEIKYPHDQNIFVTKYYTIENYLISYSTSDNYNNLS